MTGFGSGRADAGPVTVAVEIKSVNNRYRKVSVRSPDGLEALEPVLEKRVQAAVARGTVTVNLRVEGTGGQSRYGLDEDAVRGYVNQLREMKLDQKPFLGQVLSLPGTIRERTAERPDPAALRPAAEAAADAALEEFDAFREREGAAMADEMRSQLAAIAAEVDAVERRLPGIVEEYREKLHERVARLLEQAGADVPPGDLVREVAVYADKADVTEELVRLRTHLGAFEEALRSEEAPGRKLDFLSQELNREVNTIGSKAGDAEAAARVVGMKASLEKVREILQNLE